MWTLRREQYQPQALITTVTYDRISMHGVRRELLARQADALATPLVEVEIPLACSNAVYEQRMGDAFAGAILSGIGTVAFGDLFLEDVRAYREKRLAESSRCALFPLWGRDTMELANEFIDNGFEAILVCVDSRVLDSSFAGRAYDGRFLADLRGACGAACTGGSSHRRRCTGHHPPDD